ncbi:MAG: phosphoglycerate mutase family protein [Polyangiaceae bacterium]
MAKSSMRLRMPALAISMALGACGACSACSSESSSDTPVPSAPMGGSSVANGTLFGSSTGGRGTGQDSGQSTGGRVGSSQPTSMGGRSGLTSLPVAGTSTSGGASGAGGNTDGKGLTIYYIRHGEVVANTVDPAEITYENSETLTELGLEQIEALTSYLKAMNVTPDAVLVSPTRRTQKTIEPYLVARDLQGQIWMNLAECCDKTPTGAALPMAPTYEAYKAKVEAQNITFADPSETRYWSTDTYEEGLFMVQRAQRELLERFGQSGKTVFIVGHASAGLVLIGLLRGNDMSQGTKSTEMPPVFLLNTGIMRLVQDPTTGLFRLDGRNMNTPKTN